MGRPHGTKEFRMAALRRDSSDLQAIAAEALAIDGGAISIPSCPGWTMIDLVHHVGHVSAWIASHAGRGLITRPELTVADLTDQPPRPEAIGWLQHQVGNLIEVLDALDPSLPAWNWAPQAKVAGFWHRRSAHEFGIHRWDAEMALARAEPIETRLAADGVSEVLDSWLPANRRRKGPTDRFGVVHLIATDANQQWFLRLRGTGIALLDMDTLLDVHDPHPRVEASGSASDLDLALWGRIGFDMLDVTGDETLLEALRVG